MNFLMHFTVFQEYLLDKKIRNHTTRLKYPF